MLRLMGMNWVSLNFTMDQDRMNLSDSLSSLMESLNQIRSIASIMAAAAMDLAVERKSDLDEIG